MAILVPVLFGLIGSGVDYGFLVVERGKMQNAVDTATLAGVRLLVTTPGGTAAAQTAAQNLAASYLAQYGYTADGTTIVPTYTFSTSPGSNMVDTLQVDLMVRKTMYFWRVIGIQNTPLTARAKATAGGGMVDVILSLDTTFSMDDTFCKKSQCYNGMDELRRAAVEFVDQMNPDPAAPFGPKVGMARFQGEMCYWKKSGGSANGDDKMDTALGEWTVDSATGACLDDKTVLSKLTFDKDDLIKISDNSGTGTCGSLASYKHPMKDDKNGCPLKASNYTPIDISTGAKANDHVYRRTPHDSSNLCDDNAFPTGSSTKIGNGVTVTQSQPYNSAGGYLWSTANGGRNDPATVGYARKVLVLMTDGRNTDGPYFCGSWPGSTASQRNTQALAAANALKLGPDGVAGTLDDVEIYTVGFMCAPYASGTDCASAISGSTGVTEPYKCPGPTWPTTSPAPSYEDTLLRDMSSSKAGTCDHYYPLQKTDDLPQLFRVIAGSIARGKLGE
jgi:Flp pilus assembly protein TadG